MAKRSPLKWNPWEYNPQALERYSDRELRREYSRLRTIAKKRIDRLMASEFWDTSIAQYNAGRFIYLEGVQNRTELKHLLTDVSSFLMAEGSTVTGQRKRLKDIAATWQAKGYGFITTENVRGFVEFLEYVKSVEGYVYDVSAVEESYRESIQQGAEPGNVYDMYAYYQEKTARR